MSVSTSKKGHVHCYPYKTSDPIGPARTSEQVMQYAKEAMDSGSTVSPRLKTIAYSLTCTGVWCERSYLVRYSAIFLTW